MSGTRKSALQIEPRSFLWAVGILLAHSMLSSPRSL